MNKRVLKVQLAAVLFASLILLGMIPQAVWAGEVLQQEEELFPEPFTGYDLDIIYIFYNPEDEIMKAVAEGVDEVASFRINDIKMIPIRTLTDLSYWLFNNPWIAIYALTSNLTGVIFEDTTLTWSGFYQLLSRHRGTHHIVGMANTLSLNHHMSPSDEMIHHAESQEIDGLLLIVYDLWALYSALETRADVNKDYEGATEDIRNMALKLYGDNFNEIFKRTVDPINPVGQVDEEDRARRTAEMWAKHAPQIEPAAYKMLANGSLGEVPVDDLPEDFSPAIKLSTPAEVASSDFVLGEIPLLSALRGPIGEIIDVLLSVLGSEGQTTLSIPSNIVDSLTSAFEIIEPIIGIVSDFDIESPLKSVINALANEFPFMNEFKKYLDIILKALFNLRGDLSGLLEIVGELVTALLPDVIPEGIKDFLLDLLGAEDGLWDLISQAISGGKGVYDIILGFFSKNTLNKLLNKTLVAAMDLLPSQITNLLPRIENLVVSVIDFLSSKNVVKLLENVGTNLLNSILSGLPDISDVINEIMSTIELALTAVDLVDNFDANSIVELVSKVANQFVDVGSITHGAEDLARKILDIIKTVKETASSDLTTFRNDIMNILNTETSGVDQEIKDLIQDVITMLAGFFNGAFDKNSIPDLFDIAESAIQAFDVLSSDQKTQVIQALNGAVKPIMGIVAMVTGSDSLKSMVSKTVSSFTSELGSLGDMFKNAFQFLDIEDEFGTLGGVDVPGILGTAGEIAGGIVNMIQQIKGQSFQGIMQSLLMAAGSIIGTHPDFDDVPIDAFLKLLQSFFPDAFGISKDELPSRTELINEILNYASGLLHSLFDEDLLKTLLGFFMDIKEIFTNGVKWLMGKIFDWLGGMLNPVFEDLENTIEGIFGTIDELLGFSGKLPIGLGDWSLFDITFALGIRANFKIDLSPLFDMITSMIFDARSVFSLDNVADFFKMIFSFFEISPQFYAELGVSGFDTEKNELMATLLEFLGLELAFEGSAKFVLNLFTFRGGVFEWDNFFKIVEWGLHIKIHIGKVFTLLDFFTAGVGGGVLTGIMEFLGLDTIKITIYFDIILDIVKAAASATKPETSSMTLTIVFGVAIHIPIDLLIVAIILDGALEITLTFFQDFANPSPMQITLRLILTFKVKFRFLFWDTSKSWTWEPGGPWDLSPKKGEPDYEKAGQGFDSDGDGLGDNYEDETPGLDKNNPDTDGDGLNDKIETQTTGTDATNPDMDGDGLTDGEEWELGTSPVWEDSDWDDLSDFDEVRIYGTDPLTQDTDGDGLTDSYEVYTKWDLSNVTPTVDEVTIGRNTYNDHTDPLNPDTDGDGLLDGDEGPMGAYYGLDDLYNDTEDPPDSGDWVMDPNPLIFFGGYTHPLDYDTDDDSYLQLYNGVIDSQALMFLKDMSDGAEVAGFWIIVYDEEGEPEWKQVFTNPCNPDTDGDTGITDRTPQPGAWLNSDGYELAQTPPTDPTDGDSDDDGLLDGLEGVLNQWSNHTDAWDPDTDDDGLFDMQEILLGCDPRSSDTDLDMVSDGDEFYTFFTNPRVNDTDYDGLSDGEEVFKWHSNPLIDDSDGDHLLDGQEVLIYGSDPMDEDTDNDGLTDFDEILIYYTYPFEYDSDTDGLSDGEEILYYLTDPLNWDTDHDSILEPNEYGLHTWPMSDYDEVKIHHTNATEADSDLDGLSDAIELYLGSGKIPWLDPIHLDPMDFDTDDDWLKDGAELMLVNVSDIIYPYRGITVEFRYNTSPVAMDSDNDTLTDYQEVIVFNSNPALNDTDNDTISDWWEIWVYNTSALHNDTDGDGLYDFEETLTEIYPYGSWPPSNWSIGLWPELIDEMKSPFAISGDTMHLAQQDRPPPIYPTSATDPDSDDDWLPDGAEIHFYGSNPMDTDSDNDGIIDTYEFDTDFDALPDGIEFKIGLQGVFGGGILNPDSDHDGLLDGDEYYTYGTDPAKLDTDGDGYSDGLEVALGLDPLVFTPEEEFEMALALERGKNTLKIMTPVEGQEAYDRIQVSVANFTPFQDVWFEYLNDTDWSEGIFLNYSPTAQQWQSAGVRWAPGNYSLRVFGRNGTGVIHAATSWFIVLGPEPFPWLLIAAVAGGVAAVVIVGFLGYRLGWWQRISQRIRGKPEGEAAKKTPKKKPASKKKTTKSSTKKESPSKGEKGGG